jgi:hypothetical protein
MLINKRVAIQSKVSKTNCTIALTNDEYFGSMPEAAAYINLVDGGNGYAYGAPARSGNFIKYDLVTNTITTISSPYPASMAVYYTNGIRSNVNGKIYYMNAHPTTTNILVFDPTNETFTTFGVLTDTVGIPTITPAGIIYAPTLGTNKFFKIDTNTDTITELTIGASSGGGSCVYVNSGFVYFIPTAGATEFYKLNVINDVITTVSAPLLTDSISHCTITSAGLIYSIMATASTNKLFIVDISNDNSSVVDTLVVTNSAYSKIFTMRDGNVYLLGWKSPNVLKVDVPTNLITTATTIAPSDYTQATVIGDNVYSISDLQSEPILKLTFTESCIIIAGKYFPIVITTEESTLEDKFSPETLFRVKFRLANRRKGIK